MILDLPAGILQGLQVMFEVFVLELQPFKLEFNSLPLNGCLQSLPVVPGSSEILAGHAVLIVSSRGALTSLSFRPRILCNELL